MDPGHELESLTFSLDQSVRFPQDASGVENLTRHQPADEASPSDRHLALVHSSALPRSARKTFLPTGNQKMFRIQRCSLTGEKIKKEPGS